ncbi:MAG: hypothetical protein KAX05_15215 [Bacteroidales bacterium]|nr:hypothetical protein [Bacteroidales bacterium]
MTKEQLRVECSRLFACKSISDSIDLLDIYAEFLFLTVQNHHKEPVNTQADADAKMIVQMMMTKVLHLKSIILGISYNAKDGSVLNKIIDPTIVASLIRNIYETTAMFNLIYRHTNNDDEKNILYLLWVHSGLKYRQRFESTITTKENKEKVELEKSQIESIVAEIEANKLYKKLDPKNKGKIQTKLKEKDYLLRFEKENVVFLHWHELTKTMGIKDGLLENIYSYFSLYSHPSNVAVFQFADMFKKGEEAFPELVNFNLKVAFLMFSTFIADYIKLFPNVLKTFETMEIRDQIVMNFHNTTLRSKEYSINDSWKTCE